MKLNLKDEPREWRKSALLAIFGLALICSLLRWRKHLPQNVWLEILAALAVIAVAAIFQPRWFRSYHLFSMRLGFAISKILGRIFLTMFFIFILTPLGLILHWFGKDALQLKPPRDAKTYWREAKDCGPLDRLF
jgi:hypothetical protein